MLKTIGYIFLASIVSLNFMGATKAAAVDLPLPAVGAAGKAHHVARCGATIFLRQSGTELHTTRLTLRNFDPVHSVTITRLVIYNALGVSIYDSTNSGLPAFQNLILGPLNDTLGPRQSSTLNLEDFLTFQGETTRPLQMFVAWSSAPLASPLGVGTTRVVRARNTTGAVLEERARTGGECETGRWPQFLK